MQVIQLIGSNYSSLGRRPIQGNLTALEVIECCCGFIRHFAAAFLLGIWTKITGQGYKDFWCDVRRGWVRRTRSTQAQTRRSSVPKRLLDWSVYFFQMPSIKFYKMFESIEIYTDWFHGCMKKNGKLF